MMDVVFEDSFEKHQQATSLLSSLSAALRQEYIRNEEKRLHARSSRTIGLLPVEIIIRIFKTAVSSDRIPPLRKVGNRGNYSNWLMLAGRRTAVRISHVSRYWREVALSIPQLWSELRLETDYYNMELVQLFLDRAQCAPLDWHITCTSSGLFDTPSEFQLYAKHADHSQSLRLSSFTAQPSQEILASNSLQSLELVSNFRGPIPLAELPCLKRLVLSEMSESLLGRQQYPKLEHLSCPIPVQHADILESFPNLLELLITPSYYHTSGWMATTQHPISQKQIPLFRLRRVSPRTCEATKIVEVLELRQLEELSVDLYSFTSLQNHSLARFSLAGISRLAIRDPSHHRLSDDHRLPKVPTTGTGESLKWFDCCSRLRIITIRGSASRIFLDILAFCFKQGQLSLLRQLDVDDDFPLNAYPSNWYEEPQEPLDTGDETDDMTLVGSSDPPRVETDRFTLIENACVARRDSPYGSLTYLHVWHMAENGTQLNPGQIDHLRTLVSALVLVPWDHPSGSPSLFT